MKVDVLVKPIAAACTAFVVMTGATAAHAQVASDAAAQTQQAPALQSKLPDAYLRMFARETYFWAWPLANVHNRRVAYSKLPHFAYSGGVLPIAPLNQLTMLTDYVNPEERAIACPNQDVVYGQGVLALDQSPVVIQVPDFGDRFWVYQIVDQRTDSFVQLGKMYGTKPGFYLLAGPDWKGEVPAGINGVFRAKTNTGEVIPRVFQDDTAEDKRAVQGVVSQMAMYPLSDFDGKMKTHDWTKTPTVPGPKTDGSEVKWVQPEHFFDSLADVLATVPPLPGEEARYATIKTVLARAKADPRVMQILNNEAVAADKELVGPLFQFRNYGQQLPHNWSTTNNGANFGTDYLTRTAVAKSNIFVNSQNETKYFYQDLDGDGKRLNGAHRYTVTFPAGQVPPVKGFWSLTLYNEHHFFEPNGLKRYSLGTKNKGLKTNADGSLTLYVQATSPGKDKESNWLPSPAGRDFSLYMRSYWPDTRILEGQWTPPAVVAAR